MLEHNETLMEAVRVAIGNAWGALTFHYSEPDVAEDDDVIADADLPYAVIVHGVTFNDEEQTAVYVEELHTFGIVGRFTKQDGLIADTFRQEQLRTLVQELIATPNFATVSYGRRVREVDLRQEDDPDEPYWEVPLIFECKALGNNRPELAAYAET